MRFKLAPYKLGSQSAKLLAQELGILRVRPTYVPKQRDFIINWGRSNLTTRYPIQVVNHPSYVSIATNKLKTYQELSNAEFIHLPLWTTDKQEALSWVEDGYVVYCRTSLTGHSGSGIVLASEPDELVDAPLYTRYSKSKFEYRIHVFNGEVLDVQQKKRRLEGNTPNNYYIRNAGTGWVYARDGVVCPDLVINAAIDALDILGLDFGAIDIAYNQHQDKAYLYEVNTAPGLEGTTLEKYTQAFKNFMENYHE
jgi:glutathione synthase/RimK-type ligase-like ATP-grasp enzyme